MKKQLLLGAFAVMMLAGPAFACPFSGGQGEGGQMGKGACMAKADVNGDGMVSKEEFMATHEAKFDQMDANGDGNLSHEEMTAARDQMREKMMEHRDDMRQKMKDEMPKSVHE